MIVLVLDVETPATLDNVRLKIQNNRGFLPSLVWLYVIVSWASQVAHILLSVPFFLPFISGVSEIGPL